MSAVCESSRMASLAQKATSFMKRIFWGGMYALTPSPSGRPCVAKFCFSAWNDMAMSFSYSGGGAEDRCGLSCVTLHAMTICSQSGEAGNSASAQPHHFENKPMA